MDACVCVCVFVFFPLGGCSQWDEDWHGRYASTCPKLVVSDKRTISSYQFMSYHIISPIMPYRFISCHSFMSYLISYLQPFHVSFSQIWQHQDATTSDACVEPWERPQTSLQASSSSGSCGHSWFRNPGSTHQLRVGSRNPIILRRVSKTSPGGCFGISEPSTVSSSHKVSLVSWPWLKSNSQGIELHSGLRATPQTAMNLSQKIKQKTRTKTYCHVFVGEPYHLSFTFNW